MGGKTKIKRPSKQPKPVHHELSEEAHTFFTDPQEMSTFLLVLTFSQTLYFMTMYPSLAGGDSGELVTVAKEFGVAHPPGPSSKCKVFWFIIPGYISAIYYSFEKN